MTDASDSDLLRARVSALEAELARARAWQDSSEWLADPVLIHDVDGRILGANQRAADLLGHTIDELLRLDLFALEETMQGGDRAAARENWLRLEPDTPITARGRFLPREGPAIPVECTIVARDTDARRIVLVARDLSDRLRVERALRDSEQRFRFLFEGAPVGMIRCQPDGALVQVNRALGDWLGLDITALPGSPARELVAPEDRDAFTDHLAALHTADERPVHADLRLRGAGGPLWARVTLFAESDGRGSLRQVLGVIEDIDARVKAEAQVSALLASLEGEVLARTAELRRSNAQLRVEIGERERAEALLVRARERAEAANQAKSRFLMVMSHELRTPLNAILGYTDMHIHALADDGPPPPPDELLADLRKVRGAGLHLLSHIDDILHMTRLDGDARNEVTRVELAPYLRQLAEAMRLQLTRPEIALALVFAAELGALDTDAGKLQHILRHLLRNAAKFTPRGRLELHAAREPGGGLRVDVVDTGIGIPPEQLDLIFVPFAQLDDSPTRRYGGLGLGLALCRRYCDELGGSIAVESILGRGSRFTVRLPVAPPAKLG